MDAAQYWAIVGAFVAIALAFGGHTFLIISLSRRVEQLEHQLGQRSSRSH